MRVKGTLFGLFASLGLNDLFESNCFFSEHRDHRPRHRGGRGEARGLRAPSHGGRLTIRSSLFLI